MVRFVLVSLRAAYPANLSSIAYWKVNLQPNFHRFICVGIIFPSFHAKQSRITPTEPLQLLFRYQRHEYMSQKKFFPVNMKISCLFSRFVGISLESWHLEQRINTEGAFRIFCHVNRLKKIRRSADEPGSLGKKCRTACSHNSHAVPVFLRGNP